MSGDIATNRKALRDYHISDKYECGLELKGTEVKSIRDGKVNIADGYARIENGQAFLYGCHIEPWQTAGASGTTFLSGGVEVASAALADVYPLLVFGKDAYAIVPLQGANAVKPAVMNPGTPTKGDELGQRGFVSWKAWQATAILNDSWMARYEVLATANPA